MMTSEILEDLESDLMTRAFLYAHPSSYREGVEAAILALRAAIARSEREEPVAAGRRTA